MNKMPVALVNGEKLIELLFKYRVGVKEEVVSVFSIDSELFDTELSDNSMKGLNNKSRSIWPLPGGINSYVETLNSLLKRIERKKSKRDELINWFADNYDNVSSLKTANGYLNVPKNMGLIIFNNGFCFLSEAGKEYLKSQDLEFLYKTISSNIMAFEEIHQLLLNSPEPLTDQELLEYVNENFEVEWSTLAQINFRLRWLINIEKVDKTDIGYIGK